MWTVLITLGLIIAFILALISVCGAADSNNSKDVGGFIAINILCSVIIFCLAIALHTNQYAGTSVNTRFVDNGVYKLEHQFNNDEYTYFTLIRPTNNTVLYVSTKKEHVKDVKFDTNFVMINEGNITPFNQK